MEFQGQLKDITYKKTFGPLEYCKLINVDSAVKAGKIFEKALYSFELVSKEEEIELGYLLSQNYRGKGFAIESVNAVLDYAFRVLEFNRIVAIIKPSNYKSIQVAERVGMLKEKTITEKGENYLIYVINKQNTTILTNEVKGV